MFNNETNTFEIDEEFQMKLVNRQGACKYCGSFVLAEYTDAMTLEERDTMATQFCTCPSARAKAERESQIKGAKFKLEELFGENAKLRKLRPVEPEIMELLRIAVDLLGDEHIWSISIELAAGGKGKLSRNNKDKINVERTETQKYKLEG